MPQGVGAIARLDAALLVSATGEPLAGWIRDGLRRDVVSIMSVTMRACVDTLLEELRGQRPEHVLVEAGPQRFLVSRTEDDRLLVLAAPSAVSRKHLLASARALERRLTELVAVETPKRHPVTPPSPPAEPVRNL